MRWLLNISAILAVGLSFFVITKNIRVAHAQGGRTAFSATVLTHFDDGNGRELDSAVSQAFFWSDGSQVMIEKLHGTKPSEKKTIINIGEKTRTAVDPETESKTTYPLSQREIQAYALRANTNCTNTRESLSLIPLKAPPLEDKPLLGYQIIKQVRHDITDSDPNHQGIGDDLWVAPSLNCFALRHVVSLLAKDGSVMRTNRTEATAITTGEPDRSLLDVPSNYVERQPSAVFAEARRRKGQPNAPSYQARTDSLLDKVYHNSRNVRQ